MVEVVLFALGYLKVNQEKITRSAPFIYTEEGKEANYFLIDV